MLQTQLHEIKGENNETRICEHRGGGIALISADSPVITDAQSALEVAMTVRFEGNVSKIALPKGALCEEFFVLSTGIAGEILQKWINYHIKAAIYGDFSRYTSKPLKDFYP